MTEPPAPEPHDRADPTDAPPLSDAALAANRLATERRRAVQPLYSAFDDHLAAALPDGLLLAISGGRDSAVLLEALARWPARGRGRIEVASVDHGHRPAARAEAERVADRAFALGFEAVVLAQLQPSDGAEAALRRRRYRALAEHARGQRLGAVVTAHHADDDGEGLLLDLLGQGGGRGGAAMAAQSPLPGHEDLRLLRPLLGLHRVDLDLAATGLQLRRRIVDDADQRGVGARARVRRRLVPTLSTLVGGDARPRLARLARRRAHEEAALLGASQTAVEQHRVEGGLRLSSSSATAAEWRRAILESVQELTGGDGRASASTVDALAERAASEGRGSFDLTGVRAELKPGQLTLHLKDEGS